MPKGDKKSFKIVYINAVDHCSALKRKGNQAQFITWLNLEDICEIKLSSKQTNTFHFYKVPQ